MQSRYYEFGIVCHSINSFSGSFVFILSKRFPVCARGSLRTLSLCVEEAA